ncbi:hypothetical protein L208DRAFT_1381499 [Tricholoma matsutake]|nr:hypothetical protein L208DRAFT_1381499 [Tricholoma matsutake 945]
MVTAMELIEKENTRGFLHASMLDPNQPELIDESKAKPIQLDEQEYQCLCKLINYKYPMNEQLVLPWQALSAQEISIHGVSYSTSGSQDCNVIFRPTLQVISHFALTEMMGTVNDCLIHVLLLDWHMFAFQMEDQDFNAL